VRDLVHQVQLDLQLDYRRQSVKNLGDLFRMVRIARQEKQSTHFVEYRRAIANPTLPASKMIGLQPSWSNSILVTDVNMNRARGVGTSKSKSADTLTKWTRQMRVTKRAKPWVRMKSNWLLWRDVTAIPVVVYVK
jgi:hypothetical protein